MELLEGAGIISGERLEPLAREANELTAIVVASIKTLRIHRG
jgi:hypothetical protein